MADQYLIQFPVNPSCKVKGCPYQARAEGLCRGHLTDESMEHSPSGSSLLPAIYGLVT